jgi:hypothetical protein
MNLIKLRKHNFNLLQAASFFGLFFILIAGVLNFKLQKPILTLSKQDTALNFDNNLLVFFSAGNKRLITDLIWVQTLIESDNEHYKSRDLNNWLYLRFNTISHLDPRFYENYLYGGQFLAIIKDDLEGANLIYEKGLKYYPNDYLLNYHAGFLNYFEKGDFKQGLKYLEKIGDHPKAPIYIKSIINKIKASLGTDLKEVFQLVLYNYQTTKDTTLKKRLHSDLYALKAEIDLFCLNNNSKNCSKLDFNNVPYQFSEGAYKSFYRFEPYRIKKRNQ